MREAIFSVLFARIDIEGATVVDLYAGSGALGCESLSRGAASCLFVDCDRSAVGAIRDNLRRTGNADQRVVLADVQESVRSYEGPPFDLVFLDPPYAANEMLEQTLEHFVANPDLVAPGAIFVAEHGGALPCPEGLEVVVHRRYGDTHVTFMTLAMEG